MAVVHAASVLGSFPFRVAVVALCVLLLPLIPSPRAPAAGEGDGVRGQAFLAKVWELLHLLLVGIAVSYGLFSRRNDDGGRVGGGEKDAAAAGKTDARYVSRMLQGDLVFDDDADDRVPDSPAAGGARSWSALHHPEEPVVVMDTGGEGRSHAAAQQAPLSLPVRTLKQQDSGTAGYGNAEPRPRPRAQETVLPSPIPWRSRSGRFDAPTSSPLPSPKRLSPASSMSSETLANASEEQAAIPKRRSTYKSSISSAPPVPPPPPPPFLVHGYHPMSERRTTAAKSFKEELQDHSTRGRGDPDHYSHSFSSSSTYTNSSPANPKSSFDGSSSSSPSVGKSVRTVRPREGIQPQIQELSDEDEAGDARDNSHGSEEPYGYNAYQSIPRFQYERRNSDPILGRVTVSSDETESSDEDGVSAYSTKTNSPRESSTPEVDENEVDKKAEEFIAKFRESIRLQRIESIKKSAGPRGVKHGK
ncbi:unnamed protein product [Alopecurus aequalis]